MSKDTVRFDAFVNELEALEARHGLCVGASGYDSSLYVDEVARDEEIENWIELPPEPIPGDVPHEVITAVFENHVRHGELPSHWLETILRVYWKEGSRAIYRQDFQHRGAIRKMMGQVTACGHGTFETKHLAIASSCEGPAYWAAFLAQPTEWFDASTVRPYRVGVYEVSWLDGRRNMYSNWNGDYWCLAEFETIKAAARTTSPSQWVYSGGAMFRGLLRKP